VTAKKGIAPCGHPGTYVTAKFITCDQRCEFKKPKEVRPLEDIDLDEDVDIAFDELFKDDTGVTICTHCLSADVQCLAAFTFAGKVLYHCNNCARDFTI